MGDTVDKNLKHNLEKLTLDTDDGILENEELKWGLPLKNVYKIALGFYKDKEGKAFHLTYEDKLKLVAYSQQVTHGPFDEKTASPLGVLDVIGKDRRAAWCSLGNMSQVQAMAGFVHTLDRLCSLFRTYLEAVVRDIEEKSNKKKHEEQQLKVENDLQERYEIEKQKLAAPKQSEDEQVKRIKEALNAQSYEQFLEYAQQQYPGNFDQQALLIRQLQDQHYHQYMQQLSLTKRLQHIKTQGLSSELEVRDTTDETLQTDELEMGKEPYEDHGDEFDYEPDNPIEEASMWTNPDILAFKEGVRAQRAGAVLTVPHGDAITIRVPTHKSGKTFYWEFATDHYDIGFGLDLEWCKSPTDEVTIHLTGSDEEDSADEEYNATTESDIEGGSPGGERRIKKPDVTPTSSIVPIYRRDSHLEVYAGSHSYSGDGVYLLKFDNTYSIWRAKTLYYRIYYAQ